MKPAIITYADLERHSKDWQQARVVLTGGCFDVLHYGHIVFLQQAKEQGDILIVALESDTFIKKTKHREPIHSQRERASILAALKMVDYVILLPFFEEEIEYNNLVKKVAPQVIAITQGDTATEKKAEQATKVGAQLKAVTPLLSTFSTTNILNHENFHSNRSPITGDSRDTATD